MAKRGVSLGMTRWEKILGGCLLAVYLVVLPLAADPLFNLFETLLGTAVDEGLRSSIYYYVLFALTAIVFRGFWGRTTRQLMEHMGSALGAVCLGLVAFYGLNELAWRALRLAMPGQANLNDGAIAARIVDAPYSTALIVVFLAPVVEEALFRGYVFGNLREYNRFAAYAASSGLFAFLHVWQFAVASQSLAYLLLALQYLAPGLVLAWTYERSGTLWGSILLHGVVNALAVWSVW